MIRLHSEEHRLMDAPILPELGRLSNDGAPRLKVIFWDLHSVVFHPNIDILHPCAAQTHVR